MGHVHVCCNGPYYVERAVNFGAKDERNTDGSSHEVVVNFEVKGILNSRVFKEALPV